MADFETKNITYFKTPGRVNTDKTVELATNYAKDNNIKQIVVATYTGKTALKAKEKAPNLEVIAVTLHAGTTHEEYKKAWESNLTKFKEKGIIPVRGVQALSGVERAMNKRYGGVFPLMTLCDALKLFSEGTKVAVEVSLMAADAGYISPEKNIVAIAGTGGGVMVCFRPTGLSRAVKTKSGLYPPLISFSKIMAPNSGVPMNTIFSSILFYNSPFNEFFRIKNEVGNEKFIFH